MNRSRMIEVMDKVYSSRGALLRCDEIGTTAYDDDQLVKSIVSNTVDVVGSDDKDLDSDDLQGLYTTLAGDAQRLKSVADAVHELMVIQLLREQSEAR